MSHEPNIVSPVRCNLEALLESLPGAGEYIDRDRAVTCLHCLRPMPWDWAQERCEACQLIVCERCNEPCIFDWERPDDVYRMPNGKYRCVVCVKYDGTVCEACEKNIDALGYVTLNPSTAPYRICFACFAERVAARKKSLAPLSL